MHKIASAGDVIADSVRTLPFELRLQISMRRNYQEIRHDAFWKIKLDLTLKKLTTYTS